MAVTRVPKDGDRAAKDVTNYPSLHATDLEAGTPIHHVPAGSSIGDTLTWDGTKWVAGAGSTASNSIMTIGTYEGDLEVGANHLKIYNLYGADRRITKVFLSVFNAPVGADINVDITVNGSTIFGAGYAVVADGDNTGVVTTFDSDIWPSNTDLWWEIAQVGSTTPGSNLVVHIVHEAA